MNRVRITGHAIDPYIERVDGGATRATARDVIGRVVDGGKARPVPRGWMRTVRASPGLAFVYSADHPGVCLALKDDTVVTVYSRSACKRWEAAAAVARPGGRSGRGCGKGRAGRRLDLAPSRLTI